jgi:hypothetical protein
MLKIPPAVSRRTCVMEKPRVERERMCDRACGTYLTIVRKTLVMERVVIWRLYK